MTLHSVREQQLLVAPVRVLLGVAWLVAARADGASGTGSLLAFAAGALLVSFAGIADPRARILERMSSSSEPEPAPPGTTIASRPRQLAAKLLPSTVGVSVLAAVSLAFQPGLAALLGGVSVGLGVLAALGALFVDGGLLVDPKTRRLYRR
jgi:hypothetical protein